MLDARKDPEVVSKKMTTYVLVKNCIECGQGPAVTTEGTCAFCDSKESMIKQPVS